MLLIAIHSVLQPAITAGNISHVKTYKIRGFLGFFLRYLSNIKNISGLTGLILYFSNMQAESHFPKEHEIIWRAGAKIK